MVDLQQFMVDRLRRDLTRLRGLQDELVANSRDNLSTQDRIHKAILALLDAETFEHLIEIVTTDLAVLLERRCGGPLRRGFHRQRAALGRGRAGAAQRLRRRAAGRGT